MRPSLTFDKNAEMLSVKTAAAGGSSIVSVKDIVNNREMVTPVGLKPSGTEVSFAPLNSVGRYAVALRGKNGGSTSSSSFMLYTPIMPTIVKNGKEVRLSFDYDCKNVNSIQVSISTDAVPGATIQATSRSTQTSTAQTSGKQPFWFVFPVVETIRNIVYSITTKSTLSTMPNVQKGEIVLPTIQKVSKYVSLDFGRLKRDEAMSLYSIAPGADGRTCVVTEQVSKTKLIDSTSTAASQPKLRKVRGLLKPSPKAVAMSNANSSEPRVGGGGSTTIRKSTQLKVSQTTAYNAKMSVTTDGIIDVPPTVICTTTNPPWHDRPREDLTLARGRYYAYDDVLDLSVTILDPTINTRVEWLDTLGESIDVSSVSVFERDTESYVAELKHSFKCETSMEILTPPAEHAHRIMRRTETHVVTPDALAFRVFENDATALPATLSGIPPTVSFSDPPIAIPARTLAKQTANFNISRFPLETTEVTSVYICAVCNGETVRVPADFEHNTLQLPPIDVALIPRGELAEATDVLSFEYNDGNNDPEGFPTEIRNPDRKGISFNLTLTQQYKLCVVVTDPETGLRATATTDFVFMRA
jgi:hypothetical protein